MSDKPGDFFLGVIEFFGILVPGIALMVLQGESLARMAGISLPQVQQWWDWAPMLVAAYIAGHFLLALGVPLDSVASRMFPEADDRYFQAVRDHVPLPATVDRSRSSVFNAAFSFIRITSPSALSEIERRAAEYKLFRSLTLLFLLDALLTASHGPQSDRRMAVDVVLAFGAGARFLWLLVWTQRLVFEYFALLKIQDRALTRRQ